MLELKFINRDYSTVPLDKPRTTLGSDPGNDVVLPEKGIAGFQMEFFRREGEVLAVDLIGHSCMKNGQPIEGSESIHMGDMLNLESVEIEVVDPLMSTEKFDASSLRESDKQEGTVDPDLVAAALSAANDGSSAWSLKGLNDTVQGLRFPLGGKVIIGRDPSCDLVLKTAQVSRRHTEIEVLNSQLFLRDLGSTNGSAVNGNRVTTAMVKPGDKISIDQVDFLVEGPQDDQDSTVARHFPGAVELLTGPYLLVRSGSRAGQKIPLIKSRYTIGRNASNDIMLEDQSVSGRHALLIQTDGGWKIEDAESTNGTSINGEAVMGGQLHHADRIRVGSVKLAFIVPAEQKELAAEPPVAGGFDANATVRTYAIERPNDRRKFYWIGGGAVLVFLVVAVGLLMQGRATLPVLEPITAPLSASTLWQRQLPNGRSYPTAPLLADINGDGYLDVAIADGGGHLLVLDGEEGKQIFDLPIAGRIIASPIASDLTGDGIADFVVASFEGSVYAINGKAQLLWKAGGNEAYGSIQARPEVVDLDGNGVPEILLATSRKGLVALDGTDGRELWNTVAIGLLGVSEIPLVADITADGTQGLVVSTDIGEVWALKINNRGVTSQWKRELPEGRLSAPMLASGADGPLVLVASESSGIYALFGNSGLISWRFSLNLPYRSAPVILVDAQGKEQVLAVSQSGVVTALAVNGGKSLWQSRTGEQIFATGALFDLTNDGQADLVMVGQSGRLVAVDSSNGEILLTTEVRRDAAIRVSPVVGDINNDQLAEVVVSDQQGGITATTLNRTLALGTAPWAKNLHQRSALSSVPE